MRILVQILVTEKPRNSPIFLSFLNFPTIIFYTFTNNNKRMLKILSEKIKRIED